MNEKIILLDLLTNQAIADMQKLKAYEDVKIRTTKECLDLHGSERWSKESFLHRTYWNEPIPTKLPIHNTLKMIRRISLEIEREVL